MMKMNEEEATQVQEVVAQCCNWDEGNCLLLGFQCPQQLSLTWTSGQKKDFAAYLAKNEEVSFTSTLQGFASIHKAMLPLWKVRLL